MKSFSSRSIRTRLIVPLTGTATATLVLSCSILWAYQYVHYRNLLRSEEGATAQLVGEASGPALMFSDRAAARETLMGLRADPRIEVACLYDTAHNALTSFAASPTFTTCPAPHAAMITFTNRNLVLWHDIYVRDTYAGALFMQVSLAEMYGSLKRFAETILFALLASIVFGGLLASMLQRVISRPILHLSHVAMEVSRRGNYMLRATRTTGDETGVLIDHFNTMMDQIESRETDLKAAHDSLEEKVHNRTLDLESEIAERKLIKRDLDAARVAAEKASHAKSAFLANMSHELRTPLNAIIGYSELLHEDAVDSGAQELSEDINKVLVSARHLLTLISDVLDLSKIEAGKMQLEFSARPAAEALHEVVPTAEMLAKRSNNHLQVVQQELDVYVNVDPLRLRQCPLNLISNACKFTEEGLITLRMEQRMIGDGIYVVWAVSDTGIGIPAEHLERLFKSFSQVDDSNTRRFGGSGLGRAIS